MLIQESHQDIPTPTGPMRVYIISPKVPQYPLAKFPGVVVWSEIYQVTGPVKRFAGQIASQGYVVAVPCVFHEFAGTEAIAYDTQGTDDGNLYKTKKLLTSYDADSKLTIDMLVKLGNCNGRIATTGMCLGGHLAFRCAFDPRVLACVSFFGTDIHDEALGYSPSGASDSLARIPEIKGEIVMIFGVDDTHVPPEGRTLIRKKLEEHYPTLRYSWLEVQADHAFVRDESSKGRYDAGLTKVCTSLLLEVFERTTARDLGPQLGMRDEIEHVC